VGASSGLAEATDLFNRAQIKLLADLVKRHHSGKDAIGILGLSYKPNTDVVEEAFGLLLAQELSSADFSVIVYDPSADATRALGAYKTVHFASSAQECITQSGVVVLATPWQEFRDVPSAQWVRHNRPRAVVDCWRVLSHLEGVDGILYVRLGFGGTVKRPTEAKVSAN
jgi:UDPglucose 6-dehydrogenase